MRILSYIVANDSGFAPNPFWSWCTLACCKPKIRQSAEIGDLIVGLTPKALGHKIVYVMRVSQKMTFAEYWNASKFRKKKPDFQGNRQRKAGDNIYCPLEDGTFAQLSSRHSRRDGTEDHEKKKWDLSGRYVLASEDFVYFGSEAIDLPQAFNRLIVGRGHRKVTPTQDAQFVEDFTNFFKGLPRGRVGTPRMWSNKASSSDSSQSRCKGCRRNEK